MFVAARCNVFVPTWNRVPGAIMSIQFSCKVLLSNSLYRNFIRTYAF